MGSADEEKASSEGNGKAERKLARVKRQKARCIHIGSWYRLVRLGVEMNE